MAGLLLLSCVTGCFAADLPLLKGLDAVQVSIAWDGAKQTDRDSLQSAVEIKLRQSGLRVVTDAEVLDRIAHAVLTSTVFIGIGQGTSSVPFIVELTEAASVGREEEPFLAWFNERSKNGGEITTEELAAHPHSPGRIVGTWERYGAAQGAPVDTVKQIVARYAAHPYWQTPAGREALKPLMDAEVQEALLNEQRGITGATVAEAVKSYVDLFINDWLAANPKR